MRLRTRHTADKGPTFMIGAEIAEIAEVGAGRSDE
jgi:hypothetical protein